MERLMRHILAAVSLYRQRKWCQWGGNELPCIKQIVSGSQQWKPWFLIVPCSFPCSQLLCLLYSLHSEIPSGGLWASHVASLSLSMLLMAVDIIVSMAQSSHGGSMRTQVKCITQCLAQRRHSIRERYSNTLFKFYLRVELSNTCLLWDQLSLIYMGGMNISQGVLSHRAQMWLHISLYTEF